MSQSIQTPEQHIYLAKLLGYDYTIQYKAGKTITVVDALSRIFEPSSEANWILLVPHFKFLDSLKHELAINSHYTSLLQSILQYPDLHSDYKVLKDMLLYKGRIWIPKDCSMIPLLLEEFHTSPLGGHTGDVKTLSRLKENFFWEGMRKDVHKFILECAVCQSTKYIPKKPAGLLHPLSVPSGPWEDLTLDFITGLPPFHGFTVILVVVDRFSKGAHFGMLQTHYSAYKMAQLFIDMVCRLHGFPKSLVSDKDPVFISAFWRKLFKLAGTKLWMSTAYHPQTDGQTEVVNRVLQQYLRAFVHHQPNQWGKFLSLAEWSYNTTTHSTTGLSPFQVTFGKPPPSIPSYITGSSSIEVVDTFFTSREAMLEFLKKKLEKAQQHMKLSVDAHRREVNYNVGDWVYVHLRP